ncbi:MAG: hypothetical protein ACP5H2_05225 [Solirubrobacteraceae bacterium]
MHAPSDDASGTAAQSAGLGNRVAGDVRKGVAAAALAGGRGATELGEAAQALALEVVSTDLAGEHALLGHVLGMHLTIPASHLHGPREEPVLLYLFADALAIRPTRDAPMSSVPLLGLHLLLPPVAVAHWMYKAGRVEHANLDLVRDEERFANSLADWTVEDFAQADTLLDVHRVAEMAGPARVYEHLAYAHVSVPVSGGAVHLKSALPVSASAFSKLSKLFARVAWRGDQD